MRVEIVTIGTELLLGQHTDTNGAELGRALAEVGAEVIRRTTVADRPDAIRAAVQAALEQTGFVITTGGLGPTRDDVTKVVVAELFNRPLRLDAALLGALEARFQRFGRVMPATNRSQAEVPEGATVLANPRGTAPGLWIEDQEGRVAVLLPGVPREMRGLLVDELLPRLLERGGAGLRVVRSRTVRTTGVPESALAERIGAFEPTIAPLTLAYLPSVAGVDLRVTAWDMAPAEADAKLADAARRLTELAGAHYYGDDAADLAAVVLERLRQARLRVGVAESCTGGLVSERITAVPGASDTFVGGVVAYADVVKTDALQVPPATIEAHGAVSEETVSAMALGAQRLFAAECSLAVTGIAGPGGGSAEKPVGTTWLAARLRGETRAVRRVFPGDRDEIRARAAQAVLDLLRRLVSAG